jgi:hypothetical protein
MVPYHDGYNGGVGLEALLAAKAAPFELSADAIAFDDVQRLGLAPPERQRNAVGAHCFGEHPRAGKAGAALERVVADFAIGFDEAATTLRQLGVHARHRLRERGLGQHRDNHESQDCAHRARFMMASGRCRQWAPERSPGGCWDEPNRCHAGACRGHPA